MNILFQLIVAAIVVIALGIILFYIFVLALADGIVETLVACIPIGPPDWWVQRQRNRKLRAK
jgi:hypothetical protein